MCLWKEKIYGCKQNTNDDDNFKCVKLIFRN